MSTPDVSVVVPVRNAAGVIGEQIDALRSQTFDGDPEFLIALQRSDDGTDDTVREKIAGDERFRIIDATKRPGAGFARNLAVLAARAAIVAFCDADDIVDEQWLACILTACVAGMASGWIVPFQGVLDRRSALATGGYFPEVECDFLRPAYTCNLAVDRSQFLAVGGFDPHFHRNHDVELTWRMQLAGARLDLAPGAVVYKRERPTGAGQWMQSFRWGRYEPALYRRYRRHGMPRSSPATALREWRWIAANAPRSRQTSMREAFVKRSATRIGRLTGSAFERVAYL